MQHVTLGTCLVCHSYAFPLDFKHDRTFSMLDSQRFFFCLGCSYKLAVFFIVCCFILAALMSVILGNESCYYKNGFCFVMKVSSYCRLMFTGEQVFLQFNIWHHLGQLIYSFTQVFHIRHKLAAVCYQNTADSTLSIDLQIRIYYC